MIIPPIRGRDNWGDGSYGASRRKKGHTYTHKGIDYACYPDSIILSPVNAIVSRVGRPSLDKKKAHLKLIELIVDRQTKIKIMYIDPIVNAGDNVEIGGYLGISQDLTKIYNKITNHYHLEVIIEGVHVNPKIWLDEYVRRNK